MTKKAEACRVWWFDGFWEGSKHRASVSAIADYGREWAANLALTEGQITARRNLFPADATPSCLFVEPSSNRLPVEQFYDLGPMLMGGILVSGAMIDLLSEFDLTGSQIIELPLYHGTTSAPFGRPDFNSPVPGRWGLLHLCGEKASLLPEQSTGIQRGYDAEDGTPTYGHGIRDKSTTLTLDAAIACTGPDIWFERQLTRKYEGPFLSERLRTALLSSGLKVAATKWLREAIITHIRSSKYH